jgi:hypothetical protein
VVTLGTEVVLRDTALVMTCSGSSVITALTDDVTDKVGAMVITVDTELLVVAVTTMVGCMVSSSTVVTDGTYDVVADVVVVAVTVTVCTMEATRETVATVVGCDDVVSDGTSVAR